MTYLIVKIDKSDADDIMREYDLNTVFIGGWGEEKPSVYFMRRVTKSMLDAVTDQVMDIVTEGGHGETQLLQYRDEVRRVIKVMLFEEVT